MNSIKPLTTYEKYKCDDILKLDIIPKGSALGIFIEIISRRRKFIGADSTPMIRHRLAITYDERKTLIILLNQKSMDVGFYIDFKRGFIPFHKKREL